MIVIGFHLVHRPLLDVVTILWASELPYHYGTYVQNIGLSFYSVAVDLDIGGERGGRQEGEEEEWMKEGEREGERERERERNCCE